MSVVAGRWQAISTEQVGATHRSGHADSSRLATRPTPLAQPFIKWAGGKRQLLSQFERLFPSALIQGKIRRIVEPFVGSGAVFLHIAQRYGSDEIVLNDANPEIMRLYRVLQLAPQALIRQLAELEERYLALDEDQRKRFYYEVRAEYNEQRQLPELQMELDGETVSSGDANFLPPSWIRRAARTIFLNKTCFNGLFRVNAKGEFNVPFGRYRRPSICRADNLRTVAQILQRARLLSGDYSRVANWVDADTLVYFDPPYRPLSRTAHFTSYAAGGFNECEQIRLARFFAQLHTQTDAYLMLSNSDPGNGNPQDRFFLEHYAGFTHHRVQAARAINANLARRGKISELLITNY